MIIKLIFDLLFSFITFIISLIPNFDFGFSIAEVLSPLFNLFRYINIFVDMRVLLGILSVAFLRDNFRFLKNIFMSIVRKLPFSS